MIAKLKEKDGKYYCSYCLMQQYKLRASCAFCTSIFSNYISILENKVSTMTQEEISQYFKELEDRDL